MDYYSTIHHLNKLFSISCDINIMPLICAEKNATFYILDGFVDNLIVQTNILTPLKSLKTLGNNYFNSISACTSLTTPLAYTTQISDAINHLTSGDCILVVDGDDGFFIFSEKSYKTRGIDEPPTSHVLRGPREGFVEDMKTNMTMIRRRLASCNTAMKIVNIGRFTNTKVCICYLNNIADKKLVEKIENRLEQIDIDGIVDSYYVGNFLQQKKNFLFPKIGITEKPDIVVGKLLEGRIALIVDGSPAILTLPFLFYETFVSCEDYYIKPIRATMLRCVRLFAFFLGVLLPAIFVALQDFHFQLLPFKFLLSVYGNTTNSPLTPALEMLLVLLLFEVLAEASIRMPGYVGMALSIVGAIVLGETAVTAGLLSSSSILVIALSTLAIYCLPEQVNINTVLRIIFVVLASLSGLLGIVAGFVVLLICLCSMQSFGQDYLSPFAPYIAHDMQDSFIKSGLQKMNTRPYSIKTFNRTRQGVENDKKHNND